jgi:hypothetical protein
MRGFLASCMFGVILLGVPDATRAADASEQPKLPSLRANKASQLTEEQVRERLFPQILRGMTETQLQKALGTLPVLTGNGELLWVLKDATLLTASKEGKEDSEIVCWGILHDR